VSSLAQTCKFPEWNVSIRRVKPTNPGTKDKGRSIEERISKFSADQIAKSIPRAKLTIGAL